MTARVAAQAYSKRELTKIVAHQHDVRGLQRHISAGTTHGNTHRSAGECRTIVGAIAHHGRQSVLLDKVMRAVLR